MRYFPFKTKGWFSRKPLSNCEVHLTSEHAQERIETAKYAYSPVLAMPERSVSLCSHLQKGGKISKKKIT